MMRKSLGLAMIALGCSLGVAAAQDLGAPTASSGGAEQVQAEQALQVLHALAEEHALAPGYKVGAPATGSRASTSNLSATFPLGFNFFHATHCGLFVDGGGNQFFFVFPQEGGVVFGVNNENIAHGLMVPCVDGNFFAINVIDLSGTFDETFSFTFK